MWNLRIVVYIYYSFVRPVYKWLLRLTTGRCELLRIMYSQSAQLHRTSYVEYSLKHSKSPLLRRIIRDAIGSVGDTVDTVIQLKSIKPPEQAFFTLHFGKCISQINGYHQLCIEVEDLRKTLYSSVNAEHETLLLQLWNSLKPDLPLKSRIGQQWGEIGFQGDDPATDFRGMGLLGLKNLVFFSTKYNDAAQSVLSHSMHPRYGYSFAIVGINITSMAYHLLRDDHLKTHFYAFVQDKPTIEDFHLVYVHLFCEFDRFWIDSNPVNIMEFNVIREQFNQKIIDQLHSKQIPLRFAF